MKYHYIYKITNKINNKIYIGKSVDPQARWQKHVSSAKRKPKDQYFYLQASINKYGKDNFELEIIDKCNNAEDAYNREIYWIAFYKSNDPKIGMNLTIGGDGSRGHKLSKEIIERIIMKNKGKTMPEWHRKIVSEYNKNKIVSEETKKKMSEAQMGSKNHRYGKKNTEEHKQIISMANKNKIVSEETRIKKRKIAIKILSRPNGFAKLTEKDVLEIRKIYSLNDNTISETKLFKVLADKYNVSDSSIRNVIKRKCWKHI